MRPGFLAQGSQKKSFVKGNNRMYNLTKDQIEKIHGAFPEATFSVFVSTSASSSWGGANYDYSKLIELLGKYPLSELEIVDIAWLGPFPVIKQYPCVSVGVISLTGEQ